MPAKEMGPGDTLPQPPPLSGPWAPPTRKVDAPCPREPGFRLNCFRSFDDPPLPARLLRVDPLGHQCGDDAVAMIALHFDHAVLHRAAGPARSLQSLAEIGQRVRCECQPFHQRDALSATALRLARDAYRAGGGRRALRAAAHAFGEGAAATRARAADGSGVDKATGGVLLHGDHRRSERGLRIVRANGERVTSTRAPQPMGRFGRSKGQVVLPRRRSTAFSISRITSTAAPTATMRAPHASGSDSVWNSVCINGR